MIRSVMSEKNDVPVSLVWRRTARPESGTTIFPETVLCDLEKKFDFHVSFSSVARPTVLALIDKCELDEISSYLEKKYPKQFEIGLFF